MYITSTEFKELATSDKRVDKAYVVIDGVTYDDSPDGRLDSIKFEYKSDSFIGGFNAASVVVDLYYEGLSDLNWIGKEIEVHAGFDGAEFVPIGTFLIPNDEDAVSTDDGAQVVTLTAYDFAIDFDFQYTQVSLPATGRQIMTEVANRNGVDLDPNSPSLLFDDFVFTEINVNVNENFSDRELVNQYAALNLAVGTMNRAIQLTFKSVFEHTTPHLSVDGNNYQDIKVEAEEGPINSLVYEQGDVDDPVWVKDETSIDAFGLTEAKIKENVFISLMDRTTQQTIIDLLFTVINGYTYTPFEIDGYDARPDLDPFDLIEVLDTSDVPHIAPIMNISWEYAGSLDGSLSSEVLPETLIDYSLSGTDQDLLNMGIKVNRIDEKITANIEKTDSLGTKQNKFEMDLEETNLKVTSNKDDIGELKLTSESFGVKIGTLEEDLENIELTPGPPGKGIVSSTVTYQIGNDGVNAPTGTWVSSPPSPIQGKYLWTKTVTTYTSGNPITTYSISYYPLDGQKGDDGNGIVSTEIRYQNHTNGTTAPTGTWVTSPPSPEQGKYLWTRTITTYKSGNPVTTYSVSYHSKDGTSQYVFIRYSENANGNPMTETANSESKYIGIVSTSVNVVPTYSQFTWSEYKGKDGATGISITGVTNYYLASASDSGVTHSTSGWTPTIQIATAGKKYLWNYEEITYSSGNPTRTNPVIIGNFASNGIAGKGISNIVEYYKKHSSNTTAPTGTWNTTPEATDATNKYLWNYEVITYTDSTTYTSPKRVIGTHGTDGITTYTWIKYADTPTSGMSDNPNGKKYIGLAFNKLTQSKSTNYSDYEWSLMPQNITIGGRNLLLDSGKTVTNASYPIKTYDISETIPNGSTVTVTLWGELAPTKSYFRLYNSGGSVSIATLDKVADGVYQKTFPWIVGSSTNTKLYVYPFTSAQSGTSTINRIQLELADIPSDWTPAPEDIDAGIENATLVSSTKQFFLSTSKTTPPSSSANWVNDLPVPSKTQYIWIRDKMTYADGFIRYSDPYIDKVSTELVMLKDEAYLQIDSNGELGMFYLGRDEQASTVARIASKHIRIDGTTTFASGYDPSTKATPSQVTSTTNTAKDDIAKKMGYNDYNHMVTHATGGWTIIKGGWLNTDYIEANSITSDKINFNNATGINVDLTGKITANSGTIGGWGISSSYLQRIDGSVGIGVSNTSSGSAVAFWAGYNSSANTYKFAVRHNGSLLATDAEITGNIIATSGKIGNYLISMNHLQSSDGTVGMGIGGGTGSSAAFWAGYNSSDQSYQFLVRNNGSIISSSGIIGGFNISATGLTTTVGSTRTVIKTGGNVAIGAGVPSSNSGTDTSGAKFQVYHNGRVNADDIYATGGKIGALTIGTNELWVGSGSNIVSIIHNASHTGAIYAGGSSWATSKFSVYKDGRLYATSADITGKITASSGSIGNYTISSGSLVGNNVTLRSSSITIAGVTMQSDSSFGNGRLLFSHQIKVNGIIDSTSTIYGNRLEITNGKNAIVPTRDGVRAIHAYETAVAHFGDIEEVYVEDVLHIEIEPLFSDTIHLEDYHVFTTAYGEGYVWVENRTPTGFDIRTSVPMDVSYEIKGIRKTFRNERLPLSEMSIAEYAERVDGYEPS